MASYPIPSWLGPQPQFGELYSRGMAIGAQIAAQRQEAQQASDRLAHASVQAQMEAELRTKELEAKERLAQQEAAQQQQRFAIEADYKSMMLRQAQAKLMQDAQQNEQRMQLDLFKANTDWRQAAQKFDAQAQIEDIIKKLTPTLGTEGAVKEALLQKGHLLYNTPPSGLFKAPREAPTVTNLPLQGGGNVNVVQGGTPLIEPTAAGAPTMVAPGTAQFQGARGAPVYRTIPEFEHKNDAEILKLRKSMAGQYIHNREAVKKLSEKQGRSLILNNLAIYDELVKERDAAKAEYERRLPKYGGEGTNDFDLEWTGSTLK